MASDTPAVPADTVLTLRSQDWRWHGVDDGDLVLRVVRVRDDLSRYADGEVWIEGDRLDAAGQVIGWFQALVKVAALPQLPRLA